MNALADTNIAAHLVQMAQRQPHAPALLVARQRNRDGTWRFDRCTFQDLDQQSNAIANGLTSRGVKPGDRVALCVKPGVDFFAVTFALFKMHAVPVLIDPGIGPANFGRCLNEAEPSAFVGTPLAHALRVTQGWAKKHNRLNITTGALGGIPLAKIATTPFSLQPSSFSIRDDSAAVLFTSGSTGPPKGVLYTHANFSAQVRALQSTYDIQPGEIDLATFPLFGLFGPALGMTTVVPRMNFTRPGHVRAENIIEPIRLLNITNMFGSPALVGRVAEWAAPRGIKLPSLKRVICAGAPVPTSVLEQFSTLLEPAAQIFTPYGATESLPVTSMGSHEILGETRVQTDAGKGVCVGRPVGEIELFVIKITDEPIATWTPDLVLPAGQIGEIAVRGPVVTASYFNRPTATAVAKIPDPAGGFFHHTGDVGYLDDRGRLWFCGRKSQRVKLPTGDLFSTPFEAVFNTHPAVRRSALVGVTGTQGVRPVICIELKATATKCNRERLRDELLTHAARFPHTSTIKDILFHPSFPVDVRHNAKIGREKLSVWAGGKLK